MTAKLNSFEEESRHDSKLLSDFVGYQNKKTKIDEHSNIVSFLKEIITTYFLSVKFIMKLGSGTTGVFLWISFDKHITNLRILEVLIIIINIHITHLF